MTVTVTTDPDGRLVVISPHHPEWAAAVRTLGGRSDGRRLTRTFEAHDEDAVRQALIAVYGTDGSPDETVTVQVHAARWANQQEAFGLGRRIAHRPHRDDPVRLGDGVHILTGAFPRQGGTPTAPTLGSPFDPITAVLEIRDVPARHPGLTQDWWTAPGGTAHRDALAQERARLTARIAEIDTTLDDTPHDLTPAGTPGAEQRGNPVAYLHDRTARPHHR
ncbi:hypothetical protein [Streptomyces sp. NPDC088739]|uniref:hypothetical protein n=1 Tax=Streptomyces sp. NPDC088739 TaxID=3365882 RepID=UPI003828259D